MRPMAGRLRKIISQSTYLSRLILEKASRLLLSVPTRIVWAGDSSRFAPRIERLLRYRLGRLSLLNFLRDLCEQATFSSDDRRLARALDELTAGKMEKWGAFEAVQVASLLFELSSSENCLLGLWEDERFFSQLNHQDFLTLRSLSTGALYRLGCFAAGFSLSIDTAVALDRMLLRPNRLWGETTLFYAVGHLTLLHYTLLAVQHGFVNPQDLVLIRGKYAVANLPYADWLMRLASKLNVEVRPVEEHAMPEEPCLDLWPTGSGYSIAWHHQAAVLYEAHISDKTSRADMELEYDTDLGVDILSRLGWDSAAPTVGFHIQNNLSLERSLRNSEPRKYFDSMARLISEGYNVVLLGELKREDKFGLPKGVLVATEEPEKFLRDRINLAVWQRCQFFVGNNSGGTLPPSAFKTPTLYIDLYPITSFRPPGPRDCFQFKLPFSFELARFLSLSEIFSNEHRWAQVEDPRLLARAGYSVREVSSEEIDSAVREMQLQVSGPQGPSSKAEKVVDEIYRTNGFSGGGALSASYLSKWMRALI